MSGGVRWSLLARCGPLSLLGASVLLLAGAPTISGFAVAAWSCGVALAVTALLVGPHRFPLVRLVPAIIAVASIVWSNWLLSEVRDWGPALAAGLRVAYFVVPGIVFASYLDPVTLGDHLGQRLRLPARPVLAFVAALQRLDDFGEDWEQEQRVRRVRGLEPGRGLIARGRHYVALTFALLVGAVRQAGRMTVAMEARGYSAPLRTGRRRTWAEPAPWTPWDTALLVVALALAALPTVLTRVW